MWAAQVIEENEVCRLMETDTYYIVEDKTKCDMPIVHRGETETLINIIVEFTKDDRNRLIPVRVFYPKRQFDYAEAASAFQKLTRKRMGQ